MSLDEELWKDADLDDYKDSNKNFMCDTSIPYKDLDEELWEKADLYDDKYI